MMVGLASPNTHRNDLVELGHSIFTGERRLALGTGISRRVDPESSIVALCTR